MSVRPFATHTDVALVRPFEHAVALILLVLTVLRYVDGTATANLTPPGALAWAGLGAAASALILTGLHLRSVVMGRAMEQVGWAFAAVMLLGGAGVLLWLAPALVTALGVADDVLLGTAAAVRCLFLTQEARARRRVVDQLCRDEGGR